MSRKAKAQNKRADSPPPRRQLGGILIIWIFLTLFISAAGGWIAGKVSIDHKTTAAPPPPIAPALAYSDSLGMKLGDLLAASPKQLDQTDIAVMNLACSTGIPGAENLNVDACLKTLDVWAAHVQSELDRNMHLFREHPEKYENSLAYFKVLLMVCVLQEDCGIHYDWEQIGRTDYGNPNDWLIQGLFNKDRSGTCSTMPVLYVAIGRRLGFPMYLVTTKGHMFARWESADGKQRFNIEGTNHGMNCYSDEFYKSWPYKIDDEEIKDSSRLKSLSGAEEFALFLQIRGNILESQNRMPEALAAYGFAQALQPKNFDYFLNLALGVYKDRLLTSGELSTLRLKNRFADAKPRTCHELC